MSFGDNAGPVGRVLTKSARIERGERSFASVHGRGMKAALLSLCLLLLGTGLAFAETRSLKLYFIHTRERAEITYKRDGKFIPSGLAQINRFLRDWRKDETAKMDPRVIDLLWEVYHAVGARDYIHIVSAYRSPRTNAMLRSRSSGVAENSQHMLGKAIDFYIPGVKLATLRKTAMRFQYGGVGYYPKSGAPFVHLDVGNARYWPRMSRSELMAMFPDGKTVYVPSDGKPLAGYSQALASYKARRNGAAEIQLASADASDKPRRGFLANLFGGGADEDEDRADSRTAPATIAAGGRTAVAAVAPAPATTAAAIVAALPAKAVPLPGVAPRPALDIGQPAAAEAPGEAAGTAPASPYPQLALLSVPLPTPRPDYTPPSAAPEPAEAPVQVAAAEAAPAAEPARGEDTAAVSAQLRTQTPLTLAAYAPLPASRPAAEADAAIAALSRPHPAFGAAQDTEAALARAEARDMVDQKLARLASAPSASPRLAMISREAGADASAVLDAGARTSGKGARPTMADERPDPRAIAIPVPRQVARWALSNEPVTLDTRGTKAPSFAHAFVRSAPQMVYTAGFQSAADQADPNRFTGQAVVFMSVARFQTN